MIEDDLVTIERVDRVAKSGHRYGIEVGLCRCPRVLLHGQRIVRLRWWVIAGGQAAAVAAGWRSGASAVLQATTWSRRVSSAARL